MKTTIVTASDTAFFPLLRGMIQSILDHPQSAPIDISVLDIGLDDDSLAWLRPRVANIVVPGWDLDYANQKSQDRRLLAIAARPFLPKHFPGYDIHVWIDADTWIQDWSAVELYVAAAASGALGIAAEVDRAFVTPIPMVKRSTTLGIPHYRPVGPFKMLRDCFGAEAAEAVIKMPMLNAGVFSLPSEAPHWKMWAEAYATALKSARAIWLDQVSLNYMVRTAGLKVEVLPALYNWTCHLALPKVDAASRRLVEPYLPHREIGIVHLTAGTKRGNVDLETTDGQIVSRSLRYPGLET